MIIMCRVFYKYFLITSTSFMATGGLYFASLTRWLWPSPINDYGYDDWRVVPETIGSISLVLFVFGLPVVIRARIKELLIFSFILIFPLAIIATMLIMQLFEKHAELDLSDFFLTTVVILLIMIEFNLFLFVRSIKRMKHHHQRGLKHHQNNNHHRNNYHPANKKAMAYYLPSTATTGTGTITANQQTTEL